MGTISPWPQVRQGAKEHPVPALQHLLRARGHALVVDGLFGPATGAAVRQFQHRRGLRVDGIVGPRTWSNLVVEVGRGSAGEAVRGVQEEFQYRNLCGCPDEWTAVDGLFGPRTEEVVRTFQGAVHAEVRSMAIDGIVGPMTWQALVSGMFSF
jgi:peptidoglycan hydrolase-like protein with peptidoglycan-binding domain